MRPDPQPGPYEEEQKYGQGHPSEWIPGAMRYHGNETQAASSAARATHSGSPQCPGVEDCAVYLTVSICCGITVFKCHHDSLVVAALGEGDIGPCSGWRNLIVV